MATCATPEGAAARHCWREPGPHGPEPGPKEAEVGPEPLWSVTVGPGALPILTQFFGARAARYVALRSQCPGGPTRPQAPRRCQGYAPPAAARPRPAPGRA